MHHGKSPGDLETGEVSCPTFRNSVCIKVCASPHLCYGFLFNLLELVFQTDLALSDMVHEFSAIIQTESEVKCQDILLILSGVLGTKKPLPQCLHRSSWNGGLS